MTPKPFDHVEASQEREASDAAKRKRMAAELKATGVSEFRS